MNQGNFGVPYPMYPNYMNMMPMGQMPTNFNQECLNDSSNLKAKIDNLEKRVSSLEKYISNSNYNSSNYQML